MQSHVPQEIQSLQYLDENAEYNPKTITYRSQHKMGYTPYHDSDVKKRSLLGRVSSGFTGAVKSFAGTVGSMIFKKREEDSVILSSASPSKLDISVRDNMYSLSIQHPIAKIDFTDLSGILLNPHDSKLNVTKPSTNAVNVSFAGSNNTINNDFLNQSTFSFHSNTNSNSAKASDQTQKGPCQKPKSIKKKKKLNIMSAFNFYRDLFEGRCKKYSQDSQQGFGQNLKVILAKDIPRPKPNKSKQPTVTFRQNKATGGFETVRQNKKRKNMEVEAPEMKPIGSLHSKFQPPGKEKSVAPQLKKNKMTLDTDSTQPKVTLITLNFNKEKSQRPLPVVNQLPQKRANAFSHPKGAGESVFKPKTSPLRQIDFEEEKALERHMYQVDLEEIHVGPNRHKREIGLQTSEVKPSNKESKIDGNCQTSPLREKNLTNLPVNLKKDLTVAAKPENSQQICIETTFSQQQQVDNSLNQESIEINRAEQQHDVDVSKVLRFDLMESLNEQKQPEPVIIQQTQEMSERHLAPVQTENPEPKASAKKPLFSFETQLQKAFSLNEPAQQAPVELANSTTNPLGSMKKTVVPAPKPTFDFLNVYKQTQPATESMVNDANPFLSHKSEAPVVQQQQQDVQNVNAVPAANPFLKPEGNFGILGLVGSNGNNSSENKIMNNFDGGLKPVSNIGLFNSNPQSLFGPVPTTPAPAVNVNNGLFSNVNTIPRNPINNNNNNNGPTNNLFSNLNTVPQNNNNFNQQPPSFTNQSFGNDRMDISDNNSFMQQQQHQNFNNGLFNSNMHSNNMNNNNTPSFLTNNNSTNNGLFNNLAPSQPPMNQNNVSNGLFSNNMMPGARNNMNQPMMNDPFSNNSMNNQPQNPLFMNSGNNGMMNNQLNFNNAPSPSFLPQQQQQPQMNLFSNNNAPSKLVFGNNNNNINNSQSPFGNTNNNMNNSMNNNMNNDMNPFVNNNHTNMNQPFQMNNQGSNMNQGMNFMNPQRTTQDAQNFLGNANGGGDTSQGGQRVYRRIMQPTNKNKERAF